MANRLLSWIRNRGRDGWSDPLDVGQDRSLTSRNVHLYEGGIGKKRPGCTSITITGVTGPINALAEFVPGQDQTAAELFLVDASATTKIFRCAAGASFTSLTVADAVSSRPMDVSFCALNGKLYIAYDSTLNRLHVFEAAYSTTALRMAGMGKAAAAPTVADTGGGTYPATIRYYRVRFQEVRGGVLYREGPPSAIQSFTPSGAGTHARITRPTAISEGEAYWVVEASPDGVLFYDLQTIAIGTTTYDDNATVSTYASLTAAPAEGSRTPFPSVKYLATDGSRLLGLGVWETAAGDSMAPKNGRVYFTAPLDSSTQQFDDERVNNTTTLKGYIDLARNSGAVDRGITKKPVNNVFYAFQSSGVYGLIPTESAITPYRRVVIDSSVGAVSHQSIVIGNDRNGRPCAYFLDPVKGPYTVGGVDGLRWVGKDVADLWENVNLEASNVVAWGEWFPELNQVWFGVAHDYNGALVNDPKLIMVLDVTELTPDEDGDLRGGWTTYEDGIASARCACMFSDTLAATRSRSRVPYLGADVGSTLSKYDPSVNTDRGTGFASQVTSGARAVQSRSMELRRAYVVSSAHAATSLVQTLRANDDPARDVTSTVLVAPVGTETSVIRKFEDAAMQDAWTFRITLGDAGASSNAQWHMKQWYAEVNEGGSL